MEAIIVTNITGETIGLLLKVLQSLHMKPPIKGTFKNVAKDLRFYDAHFTIYLFPYYLVRMHKMHVPIKHSIRKQCFTITSNTFPLFYRQSAMPTASLYFN